MLKQTGLQYNPIITVCSCLCGLWRIWQLNICSLFFTPHLLFHSLSLYLPLFILWLFPPFPLSAAAYDGDDRLSRLPTQTRAHRPGVWGETTFTLTDVLSLSLALIDSLHLCYLFSSLMWMKIPISKTSSTASSSTSRCLSRRSTSRWTRLREWCVQLLQMFSVTRTQLNTTTHRFKIICTSWHKTLHFMTKVIEVIEDTISLSFVWLFKMCS